jgi:hypothetical protein
MLEQAACKTRPARHIRPDSPFKPGGKKHVNIPKEKYLNCTLAVQELFLLHSVEGGCGSYQVSYPMGPEGKAAGS